tara:strand:- start:1169 stop:1507 length:339 start_codon:yes stop_codon:yes gene_type:complete
MSKIEATRTEAIPYPKYKIEGSRLWFVDVECGACGAARFGMPLSALKECSAITCGHCKAEMYMPKKKRGRPLGSGTARKVRGIRFSDEEWAAVGKLANKAGLDRSAYLRSLI